MHHSVSAQTRLHVPATHRKRYRAVRSEPWALPSHFSSLDLCSFLAGVLALGPRVQRAWFGPCGAWFGPC